MIDDIQRRLERKIFQPFIIVTSSGEKYRAASRDHVSFGPRKSRVVVWFDDDTSVLIAGLHIAAIEEDDSAWKPTRPNAPAS